MAKYEGSAKEEATEAPPFEKKEDAKTKKRKKGGKVPANSLVLQALMKKGK